MTAKERKTLSDEWTANEERIAELPASHAERMRLKESRDEIEFLIGEAKRCREDESK